jgi:YVTN family beta-propeller protein
MAELPTGTVTFLFTDIEGSTRLERELRERYGGVLAEHQRLLRQVFVANGGREVDTQGDSFFYVFPRAKAAVQAAVEAQRALASHPWPEGGEVRVRIGLNTGEAALEEGRYVGFAVHRAARISAAGHGGQMLLSSSTRELVEHDLPQDQVVRDLGERRLKDLPRPERIYQLVVDGLPSDFPPLRTLDEQELAEAAQAALARRRYRRRIAVAIPAALLLGGAIVAAVLLTQGSGAITVEPNSVAIIDPESNEVVGQVPVGILPGAVAVGQGWVWVASLEDRTLAQIESATRRVSRNLALDGSPTDVAVGAGGVWVAYGFSGAVARVDPGVDAVGDPIEIAGRSDSGSVAIGEGGVWVAYGIGVVARVSADGRRDALGIAGTASGIAVGEGWVWVTNLIENSVSRINPRTAQPAREIAVGERPRGVAVGAGAVWVASAGTDSLYRLDAAEDAVDQVIRVGDRPTGVAVGEGAVWVANSGDGTVSKVDPGRGEVVETIEIGNAPEGIATGAGAVWVTVQEP